jgi:nucleoside-diphosphate-sugar epimerase
MNKEMLHVQVIRQNITQIYLLAAILSATGEKNPSLAWHLNMQSLLNVLDIAREEKIKQSVLAQQYRRVWPYFTKTGLSTANHYRTDNRLRNQ